MTASKDMGPMTKGFGSLFIKNQFRAHLPDPPKNTNLNSKVAIVTGYNSGLGLESSKQLLRLGLSHLIMAVRSLEKGKAAATMLRKDTGSDAKIDTWALDMTSYDSVQQFAKRCDTELPRIDIAILNAGFFPGAKFSLASTGHEQ
ncbi:Fc.00g115870.m01.CDS01 [Cosmosporella sp. VM-42]